jgi:hypothetical protein
VTRTRAASPPTTTALAAALGVSRTAIYKAHATGRLDRGASIATARRQWAERTDPSFQRKPVGTADRYAACRDARLRYEAARAEEKEIRVQRLKDELIDRAKVTRLHVEISKLVRETLERWPARVAAPLAAKLGLDDPHLVATVLTEAVDELLVGIIELMKREP